MEAVATALAHSREIAPGKMAQIEGKAREFEALMIAEFLKPMFASAKTPALFGGDGSEQAVFGDMLQETYAAAIAERGGIGIADQVKAALISLQMKNGTEGMGS
ncbi:MAG: rod-binding protein [Pseudomonadota bacterium]